MGFRIFTIVLSSILMILPGFATGGTVNQDQDKVLARHLESMKSPDPRVRLATVRILARNRGEAVIKALIVALSDSNPQIISAAEEALIGIGPPAVDALADCANYNDRDSAGFLRAAGATRVLEKLAPRILEQLLAIIKEPDIGRAGMATGVLSRTTGVGPRIARELLAANDKDLPALLRVASEMGEEVARVVPALEVCLEKPDVKIRLNALSALSRTGEFKRRSWAAAVRLYRDANPGQRQWLTGQLPACNGPDGSVQGLIEAFEKSMPEASEVLSLLKESESGLPDRRKDEEARKTSPARSRSRSVRSRR